MESFVGSSGSELHVSLPFGAWGEPYVSNPTTWPMGKAMSERPSIWYHRVTSMCLSAWWGPETGSRYNIRFDRGEMVTLTREREYNFFFFLFGRGCFLFALGKYDLIMRKGERGNPDIYRIFYTKGLKVSSFSSLGFSSTLVCDPQYCKFIDE